MRRGINAPPYIIILFYIKISDVRYWRENIIGSISPLPKFIKNDSFDLLNVISVNPDLSLYDMSISLSVLIISVTMTFLILQPIISCHTESTVIFLSFILSTLQSIKKRIHRDIMSRLLFIADYLYHFLDLWLSTTLCNQRWF